MRCDKKRVFLLHRIFFVGGGDGDAANKSAKTTNKIVKSANKSAKTANKLWDLQIKIVKLQINYQNQYGITYF